MVALRRKVFSGFILDEEDSTLKARDLCGEWLGSQEKIEKRDQV